MDGQNSKHFIAQLNKKLFLSDLIQIYDLLLRTDPKEMINFINDRGITILHQHLIKQMDSFAQTLENTKQIEILRCLSVLIGFQIKQEQPDERVLETIILNYSETHIELTTLTLDLLTQLCWNSDGNFEMVMDMLKFLQKQKKYSYIFQPFLKVLEESNNVVMLVQVTSFILTLIEAPSNPQLRLKMKIDLLKIGFCVVLDEVKNKLKVFKSNLIISTYESVMRSFLPGQFSYEDLYVEQYQQKQIYLKSDDSKSFQVQLETLGNQMTAFDELLKELEEEEVPQQPTEPIQSNIQPNIQSKSKWSIVRQTFQKTRVLNLFQPKVVSGLKTNHFSVLGFQQTQQHTISQEIIDEIAAFTKLMKDEGLKKQNLMQQLQVFTEMISSKGVSVLSKLFQSITTNFIKLFSDSYDQVQQVDKNNQNGQINLNLNDVMIQNGQLQLEILEIYKQQQESLSQKKIQENTINNQQKDILRLQEQNKILQDQIEQNLITYSEQQILKDLLQKQKSPSLGSEYLKVRLQLNRMKEEFEKANNIIQKQNNLSSVYTKIQRSNLEELKQCQLQQKLHINQCVKLDVQITPISIEKVITIQQIIPTPPPQVLPPPPPRPPPPPPPRQAVVQAQSNRTDRIVPSVKVKQVAWNPIQQSKVKDTIWEQMEKVELNFTEIEQLFAMNQAKVVEVKITKPLKLTLLSAQRSKNIEITLSRLKISFQAISQNLWSCDAQVLNQNIVEILMNCLPQDGEDALYKNPNIDMSSLLSPDLYFIQLLKINDYQARLESLSFEFNCIEQLQDLFQKINIFSLVCENTLVDSHMKILFNYVLGLGNFLNSSTNKADALGFKLESFEKTVDIQSVDNQQNVLMYLITQAEKNLKIEIVDTQSNLEDLLQWTKIPLSQLHQDSKEIQKGLNWITKAIKSQTNNDLDKVEIRFTDLQKELTIRSSELSNQLTIAQLKYEKSTSSDLFFQKIYKIKQLCKDSKLKMQNIQRHKESEEDKLKLTQIQKNKLVQIKNTDTNVEEVQNVGQIINNLKERRQSKQVTLSGLGGGQSSLNSLLAMQKKLKESQEKKKQ